MNAGAEVDLTPKGAILQHSDMLSPEGKLNTHPIVTHNSVRIFRVTPENTCLESLSPREIDALFAKSLEDARQLLVRCVLAVLNSGEESDDVRQMLAKHQQFAIDVERTAGGIELVLHHAPINAFVIYEQKSADGYVKVPKLIEGLRQHVFAVIRDLLFINSEIERTAKFDLESPDGITDAVFLMLRNAGVFQKPGVTRWWCVLVDMPFATKSTPTLSRWVMNVAFASWMW